MNRNLLLLAGSALAFAVLFTLAPRLDLVVTGWFYDPVLGFSANDNAMVRIVYTGVLWGSRALLWVLGLGFLVTCVLRGAAVAQLRRRLGFLLLAFLLGPGLIVDVALKDHWGRARPHQVQEFGGKRQYTPPLKIAQQCADNCSFVSGHASAGFALIAFGFLFTGAARRRWFVGGLAAGLVVGLVRVMQGGHFMSDVIFSFYFTTLGVLLAAWVFKAMGWTLTCGTARRVAAPAPAI
jgi:lipid A 4'-phosphatase